MTARQSTRLLLVRHAHVDTGPAPGRLCGWFDVPLSDRGRAQLDLLRARPNIRVPPDAVYTSPLVRARDVAAVLAERWHLRERIVPALREIHCGELEGQPIAEVARRHPELWSRNMAQQDDDFAWPGGESYRQFRRRLCAALSTIAAQHRGGTAIVVTHAGVVSQVLGILKDRPAAVWEPDRPAPLTVTELTWGEAGPQELVRFGVPAID